jgi:hypothetical protein
MDRRITSGCDNACIGIEQLRLRAASVFAFFRAGNAAWTTLTANTIGLGRIFVEFLNRLRLFATGTHSVCIWIASGISHALSHMEQFVIGRVLANHQIHVRVITFITIHMVNFRALWQRLTEGIFGDQNVQPFRVFVASSGIFSLPGSARMSSNEVEWLTFLDISRFIVFFGNRCCTTATAFAGKLGISHREQPPVLVDMVKSAVGVSSTAALYVC